MNEKNFLDLGLDQEFVDLLATQGFTVPTPIQQQAIPLILQNKDIFAQAETGSGKTATFAFPIIHLLRHDPTLKEIGLKPNEALFVALSPSRELAQQTFNVFSQCNQTFGLKIALAIGGEEIGEQKDLLENGVHILVATPGRLIDLFKRGIINFTQCQGLVLDEVDRLFDMGFKTDLHFILHKIPQNRQLIMVSATTNFEALTMSYRFHSTPVEINMGQDQLVVEKLSHKLVHLGDEEKMPYMVGLLRQTEGLIIVFCNTRIQTHVISTWLNNLNFKAIGISGSLPQSERTDLLDSFRRKEHTILVATDLAARGLDLDGITLVVNYDLPYDASQYVHRIGRTARGGKSGDAISLCTPQDCQNLPAIEDYLKNKIPVADIDETLFAQDIGEKPRVRLEEDNEGPSEGRRFDKGRRREENTRGARGDNQKFMPKSLSEIGGGRKNERSERTERPIPVKKQRILLETGEEMVVGGEAEKAPRKEKAARIERPSKKAPNNNNSGAYPQHTHLRDRPMPVIPVKQGPKVVEWKDFPRRLKLEAYSLEKAREMARAHFKNLQGEQLEHRLLKEGAKRFWFFGPTKKLYLFYAKNNVSLLIKNFLDFFISASHIHILYDISFKNMTSPIIRFFGADEGLFTRNNGEMLEAIEHLLLKYIVQFVDLDSSFKITVQCKHFNQERDQRLYQMAKKAKDQVVKNKEEVLMPSMNPADRRLIHQYFSDDKEVKTESVGTGHFKQIKLVLVKDKESTDK